MACQEGQGNPYQSPRIKNGLKSLSMILKGDQGENGLPSVRQHDCNGLSNEERGYPLKKLKGFVR